jgi:hypothetical protein
MYMVSLLIDILTYVFGFLAMSSFCTTILSLAYSFICFLLMEFKQVLWGVLGAIMSGLIFLLSTNITDLFT